ncbi:MAG: hypothetical protein R3C56_41425 [Pirellulaceae bacterium]
MVNNEEQNSLFNDLVEQFARFNGIPAAIDVIEMSCRANIPSDKRLADVLEEEKNRWQGSLVQP